MFFFSSSKKFDRPEQKFKSFGKLVPGYFELKAMANSHFQIPMDEDEPMHTEPI